MKCRVCSEVPAYVEARIKKQREESISVRDLEFLDREL